MQHILVSKFGRANGYPEAIRVFPQSLQENTYRPQWFSSHLFPVYNSIVILQSDSIAQVSILKASLNNSQINKYGVFNSEERQTLAQVRYYP
jgi:hypothetical protein